MTNTAASLVRTDETDEFLWLEDIHGETPLKWVAEQNERTLGMIASPSFDATRERILEVLDSNDRIPLLSKRGEHYYNFWKDADHPRGLWRRTTLESYRQDRPDWDILLDLDELGRNEGAAWVWAGAEIRYPDFTRALIRLSPDGGDAVAIREFDLETRQFVKDGFEVPVAKTYHLSWIDDDTVFVATDFGPGSLTSSSYPRLVKRWKRGQPLSDATLVFEIPEDHMMAGCEHDYTEGFERDVMTDVVDFFHSKTSILQGSDLIGIDAPDDADIELHREWLLIRPRSAWPVGDVTWPAGSLLVARLDAYLAGERDLRMLFEPDAETSLAGWNWTRHHLLLTLLHNVSSRIEVLTPGPGDWQRESLAGAPALHSVSASGVDADENDDYWLIVSGFLTPSSLQLGTIGGSEPETLKSSPSFFDESRFVVEQHFVKSKDGTRVPYFQVSPRGIDHGGANPTLLTGYGGFEIPLTPGYNGAIGRAWLERGGVYVIANIRGGGEYGPAWHTAALQANRHRAYEDFAAVAQDLIDRGITSPAHLGCEGGSNGGLLVGNMLTHYPELFGAVACEVPLLDMRRYTKLSAGYSWIAEYGDPEDPAQWEFIRTFSPYHNLKPDAAYPPVLFYTATSDDRVGPVQARKMAARMQAMGIDDVWFYENREGGHGAAADNKQSAHMRATAYEFLWERLR
jgi:prolyl oligopeptidase